MRKLILATGIAALVSSPMVVMAQDQAGTPTAGQPATGPEPGSTGTGTTAGGEITAGGGLTPEQAAALQQKVNDLQKQLDDLKTARGSYETWLDYEKALQKQLDDLKAAITKANTTSAAPSYGKLTIDGLAQVWIGLSNHRDPPTGGSFNGYFKTNGFGGRLRRFEVALNGQLDPHISYHGMADFTRTASTQPGTNGILQDLFVQYDFSKADSLYVGQLKLPLTEIGLHSSAHLPTIERPLFTVGQRNLAKTPAGFTAFNVPLWGDIRETGVQYRRTVKNYTLQGAITQGAGDYQNSVQPDYSKQFTAQVFIRPTGSPNLQFGATGSAGGGFLASTTASAAGAAPAVPAATARLLRVRGGGSVIYSPGRWYFQSEYMAGSDGVAIQNGTTNTLTAIRHGEFGLLGYDLGGYKAGDGNQLIGQIDYWAPGVGLPNQTNYTLGINHDMDKAHHRIQINYVHQHYDGGLNGQVPSDNDNDQLVMAFAANW